jgi:hypothetical protein
LGCKHPYRLVLATTKSVRAVSVKDNIPAHSVRVNGNVFYAVAV